MCTHALVKFGLLKTVCCTDRVFRRGCQIRRRGHRLYAADDAEGGEPLGHLREGGHLREVGLVACGTERLERCGHRLLGGRGGGREPRQHVEHQTAEGAHLDALERRAAPRATAARAVGGGAADSVGGGWRSGGTGGGVEREEESG